MTGSSFDHLPSAFSPDAFRGRVYGVTGSAHGIGESTVRQLSRLGASVVVIDVDRKNLRRVEADLAASGASSICVHGDITEERILTRTIRTAHKRWGRLDGWVNNAMDNPGKLPDTLTARELQRTFEVNIVAAWRACALLVPIMKAQGGGSIVNISSIMSHLAMHGNSGYSMAKAAIEGMTRNFAVDLAEHRIRVNVVVPGAINTRYGPPRPLPKIHGVLPSVVAQRRLLSQRLSKASLPSVQPWPVHGEARDVADVILFLLSDASRFITGATLHVDGGATAYRPSFWQAWSKEALRDRQKLVNLFQKYPALRKWNRRKRPTNTSKRKRHD